MTTDVRLNAAEVKKAVDILDVLDWFGARFDVKDVLQNGFEEIPVFCPFCEDRDSRKPAGSVNMLKQVYHCWVCGAGGDVISLAEKHIGFSTFQKKLEWLMESFGGSR